MLNIRMWQPRTKKIAAVGVLLLIAVIISSLFFFRKSNAMDFTTALKLHIYNSIDETVSGKMVQKDYTGASEWSVEAVKEMFEKEHMTINENQEAAIATTMENLLQKIDDCGYIICNMDGILTEISKSYFSNSVASAVVYSVPESEKVKVATDSQVFKDVVDVNSTLNDLISDMNSLSKNPKVAGSIESNISNGNDLWLEIDALRTLVLSLQNTPVSEIETTNDSELSKHEQIVIEKFTAINNFQENISIRLDVLEKEMGESSADITNINNDIMKLKIELINLLNTDSQIFQEIRENAANIIILQSNISELSEQMNSFSKTVNQSMEGLSERITKNAENIEKNKSNADDSFKKQDERMNDFSESVDQSMEGLSERITENAENIEKNKSDSDASFEKQDERMNDFSESVDQSMEGLSERITENAEDIEKNKSDVDASFEKQDERMNSFWQTLNQFFKNLWDKITKNEEDIEKNKSDADASFEKQDERMNDFSESVDQSMEGLSERITKNAEDIGKNKSDADASFEKQDERMNDFSESVDQSMEGLSERITENAENIEKNKSDSDASFEKQDERMNSFSETVNQFFKNLWDKITRNSDDIEKNKSDADTSFDKQDERMNDFSESVDQSMEGLSERITKNAEDIEKNKSDADASFEKQDKRMNSFSDTVNQFFTNLLEKITKNAGDIEKNKSDTDTSFEKQMEKISKNINDISDLEILLAEFKAFVGKSLDGLLEKIDKNSSNILANSTAIVSNKARLDEHLIVLNNHSREIAGNAVNIANITNTVDILQNDMISGMSSLNTKADNNAANISANAALINNNKLLMDNADAVLSNRLDKLEGKLETTKLSNTLIVLAEPYSDKQRYVEGQYALYNDMIYRCIATEVTGTFEVMAWEEEPDYYNWVKEGEGSTYYTIINNSAIVPGCSIDINYSNNPGIVPTYLVDTEEHYLKIVVSVPSLTEISYILIYHNN